MAAQTVKGDLSLLPSKTDPSVRRWQRLFRPTKAEKSSRPTAVDLGLVTLSASLIGMGAFLATRASHLRKLEGLVPKIETQDPKKFFSLLKEGDLIFVESTRRSLSSPSGVLMRKTVGSMPHVAIYTGNKRIAHITPDSRKMIDDTLERWVSRSQNMVVIRPDGNLGSEIARKAKESVGSYDYVYGAIPKAMAGSALPKSVGNKVSQIKNGKVICTTATADILKKAGAPLPKQPGQMLTIDFRSLDNPPVVQFKGKQGLLRTSPYQGLGFLIPGLSIPLVSQGVDMNPIEKTAFLSGLRRKGQKKAVDTAKDLMPKNVYDAMDAAGIPKKQQENFRKNSKDFVYNQAVGAGFRNPVKATAGARKIREKLTKDPQLSEYLAANPEFREMLEGAERRTMIGPAAYIAGGGALAGLAASKTASARDSMDTHTQDLAGRIMAHAFNDEIEKISGAKTEKAKDLVRRGYGAFDTTVRRKLSMPTAPQSRAKIKVLESQVEEMNSQVQNAIASMQKKNEERMKRLIENFRAGKPITG